MIYHLARFNEWKTRIEGSYYKPPSLIGEGFIHCSLRDNLVETAQRWFREEETLVVLCINPGEVTAEIRYENSPERQTAMPHIIGPIPLNAIRSVQLMTRDENGNYFLPELPDF